MPLDPLVRMLLERQMASHPRPNPSQPMGELPISRPATPEGDLTVEGFNSMVDRGEQRRGLPGDTPYVDPRTIDPANSPLMSLEGIKRGDIALPSKGRKIPGQLHPYAPGEDLSNLMLLSQIQNKYRR